MSAELSPSRGSEDPDAAGDAESWSELKSLADGGGVGPSWFIATRTDAASSNWTCWCFEINSFDVYDHSGVCSHLQQKSCQQQLMARQVFQAVRRDSQQVIAAARQQKRDREGGHEQMLGQTTAVLVSLPALIASQVVLLSFALDRRLAFAGAPHPRLVEAVDIFVHVVVLVVVDRAFVAVTLATSHKR